MPTALVTGTRGELGAAYARELAERGYSIVLVADDAIFLADAAERLGRATGAIVETLVAGPDRPDPALRRLADPGIPVELLVAADPDADPAWHARLTGAAVTAMAGRGRGAVLLATAPAGATGPHPLPGVTVTTVRAGRAGGPAAIRRALDDAARGRAESVPGLVDRALGGHLGASCSAVRAALPSWSAARSAWAARSARSAQAGAARGVPIPAPAGETRPSPVPTPFRSGPPARLRILAPVDPGAPYPRALPALPVRPAHVAGPFPEPRVSGTGPLPAVAPRTGAGARTPAPRPVQRRVPGPAAGRTVGDRRG